jgi:hypothetical protein
MQEATKFIHIYSCFRTRRDLQNHLVQPHVQVRIYFLGGGRVLGIVRGLAQDHTALSTAELGFLSPRSSSLH